MAAATTPAREPATLMAPSRPGSTDCKEVIMRGCPPSTCPISEEAVSAAASASAATAKANSMVGVAAWWGTQRESMSHDWTGLLETNAARPRLAAT